MRGEGKQGKRKEGGIFILEILLMEEINLEDIISRKVINLQNIVVFEFITANCTAGLSCQRNPSK